MIGILPVPEDMLPACRRRRQAGSSPAKSGWKP